jgi:ribonuclease HI
MDETQKVLGDQTPGPGLTGDGETLLLYVTATTQVISASLVAKREQPRHVYKVQRLIYYICKVLSDCKTHYNPVQKLRYTNLITKHKLLHYFESHLIRVVTSFGLGEIIGSCLPMGRIARWLMELDITYVSQTTIKS